jgi:MFS family permease
MDPLEGAPASPVQSSALRRLRSSWSVKTLSGQFWFFFIAAFFFDFGIALFFFLFNLFLVNEHFNERSIGMIMSALTLGNVASTIPCGILARRLGLQKLLLFTFLSTPVIFICRTSVQSMSAQMILAFLGGAALSSWPVCFAPTIAKLTTERNRVLAFSISLATGIGTGAVAGLVGGWIPDLLQSQHLSATTVSGMRLVLIGASLFVICGVWPILHLRLDAPEKTERRSSLTIHPYLMRFLPVFALWSLVTGMFVPFAPIFFNKQLGLPLQSVGTIFSAGQIVQAFVVLGTPVLFRKVGVIAGIICAQIIACAAILGLYFGHTSQFLIGADLVFTAAQFGATPGFYSLIMSRVPDSERSSASAFQNLAGSLVQAGSAAFAGWLIVRHGYSSVFAMNAALSLVAVALSLALLSFHNVARDSDNHSAALVAAE